MNIFSTLTNTYALTLLIVASFFFLVLVLYYALAYFRVGRQKKGAEELQNNISDADLPSVSVVMTVHNDAYLLKDNLVYLLEQDYPRYEVVIVDYMSQDDTPYVLKVLKANYPHLKVVNFKEDVNMYKGPKYPLSIGIRSATNDVILLTEPDCKPLTFNWVKTMAAGFVRGYDMVAGYSGVRQEVGGLNMMMQYDNMESTATMIGMSMMGCPYTAMGSNLSYKRSFFMNRKGFISHYSIPEGSDDIFVNQNATRSNFRFVLHSDAFVERVPASGYKQWRLQRKKRYATKHLYSFGQKLLLMLHPLSLLLFYLSLVLMLVHDIMLWPFVVALFVLKIAWQIVSFGVLNQGFGVKQVHFWSPLYEFYFLVANTFLYFSSLTRKNK